MQRFVKEGRAATANGARKIPETTKPSVEGDRFAGRFRRHTTPNAIGALRTRIRVAAATGRLIAAIDRIGDEANRSVHHRNVDAAGVSACRRKNILVLGVPRSVADKDGIRRRVSRYAMEEETAVPRAETAKNAIVLEGSASREVFVVSSTEQRG